MNRSLRPPDHHATPPRDEVVLVDDAGRPVGRADRTTVHTTATPLHLAFSTYLFNHHGEVLLTRRALHKGTWPGVWTNSCCGHPRPDERTDDAARRRIREELGLHVGPLIPLLPDFRYRATDASGVVENELCPVYAAFVGDEEPSPDPAEVAEWAWVRWEDLTQAVAATPRVYSPWTALQVPRIEAAFPGVTTLDQPPSGTVAEALEDIDRLLATEVEALRGEWERSTAGPADVLAHDLPQWLGGLLLGHGKRLRSQMAYWGYAAAGGVHGGAGYRPLIRAAAALETLHLFALVHDDVMDESEFRRGRPAAHIEAGQWHREAGARGDGVLFGRNLAILLGDLAHTIADRLIDGLPSPLREVWYALSIELMAGQRADLTGAALGRRDRGHAEHVARMKSGRYTVTRPLQLGATAAGAPPEVLAALTRCGDHLGYAFALRDDYLGVWGDPAVTGKPAGDDLAEAKPTVVLSLADQTLTGAGAALLARVGTPDFRADEVTALADMMRAAGIDAAIEQLITTEVDAALAALDGCALAPEGVAGIREAAYAVAWREA